MILDDDGLLQRSYASSSTYFFPHGENIRKILVLTSTNSTNIVELNALGGLPKYAHVLVPGISRNAVDEKINY